MARDDGRVTLSGDLDGAVVVVTGGSRGIGRAIVREASARGARVAYCARTLEPRQDLPSPTAPYPLVAVRADVSREEGVAALFDATLSAFGRVDVVVNNAGISREALLVSLPAEVWDEVIATNLTGPFLVSRRAIEEFLARPSRGKIITIGSVMQNGAPSNAAYAASKGGLVGLTRSIAREYGPQGISAYLVVVGAVETELTREVPEAMKRGVIDACPQRRQAQAHEIASAVLFLASGRAGLGNGEALYVGGGLREVMV